MKSNKK